MIFKDDILRRIKTDFTNDAPEAISVLTNAMNKTTDLNNDRVIRCIVFLAKGNLGALHTYSQAAATDTRDIMFWAEYEAHDSTDPVRRCDFTNTFEKSSIKE